jgi:coiled-coil domain-containing protein 40
MPGGYVNRKYEKLVSSLVDVETGPLEATINNLQKEIDVKNSESNQLQKRWIGFQTELVNLQNENNKV